MELGLSGKTAVVTGGAKGFGRAVCRVLAEEGANVVMNYRSRKDEAEALIRQMNRECSGKVFGFQGDMMEESDRNGLFLAACEQFGGADILVNNAAAWTTSMAAKMPEEDFRRVLEMNLTVPFLLSQKLICHLTEAGKKGKYFKCGFQSGHHGIKKKSFPLCIIESRSDRAYQISCQGNCRIRNYCKCHCSGIHEDRHAHEIF